MSVCYRVRVALCVCVCVVQGKGNKGFDVLYHNFKAGVSASRELNEFLKERYFILPPFPPVCVCII